jgi:hypothetical protein
MAGCEFVDIQIEVRRHGLEKTLAKLAKEGVYLTQDEFKGRKEVVRGGRSFAVSRKDLELRDTSRGLILNQSSGTRGQPQRYAVSLDRWARSSVSTCIFLSTHDLFNCSHAIYDAILPTTGGIRYLLRFAKNGIKADRWFARRVPMNSWPEATFHYLTTSLIVSATRLFGPGSPWPEFLDSHEVGRIVDWIVEKKKIGRACCVRTTASNAVRIARTAQTMGESLDGAKFVVSGEPLTESKRAFIEEMGGHAIPCYGCAGLNQIGYGCGNPRQTDDLHVSLDLLAVIQQPRSLDANGLAVYPFLFTTLSPLDPLLHINVENGDFGVMETRECGCDLEKAGFTLHLHQIRSFEKLTGEGMSYYYGGLFELLETTFPCEFGGSLGDYQLVEEEDGNGQTRLTLVVHPEVGELDEGKILARLRAALSDGSRGNRFMTWVWQDAGTFRLTRAVPYTSPRGKILPLHISQTKIKLPGTEALSTGIR